MRQVRPVRGHEVDGFHRTQGDDPFVGARVAGSVLATRLGQLGHRVLVLEKADFPSDTLSTAFFRAPALKVFEKIDVLEEVKSAAPPMKTLWNYIDGHALSDPVAGDAQFI